jgi:CRP-like cAMP-binding protein
MAFEDLIPFLRSIELFQDLTSEELASLSQFLQKAVFKKGDWIIREGEGGQQLFLLKAGRAEIVKEEKEYGHFQHLSYLEKGEWVGEMAHFEKEKRSASIRALEEVEMVILPLDELENSPGKQEIYSKIATRLAKKISQRLRKTGESLVDSLNEKLRIMQAYTQVSKTIIHMFILIALWFNASKLIDLFPLHKPILDPIFTATLVLLFGASTIYVIKSSGYPLSFYGLTLQKWGRHIFDAALYTIPILIFITFLKWILVANVEMFKGIPIFSSRPADLTVHEAILLGVIYLLFIPVQELVARGFLQSCLRNFFQGPDRVFMAILTSNLLFEIVHTVKNFWFAVGTFFLGIYWGILFEQQKSLVGVCVSHMIVGGFFFFVLDYQTLFNIFNAANP